MKPLREEDEQFYRATIEKYFEMGEEKLIARAEAQAKYRRGRNARLRTEHITQTRTTSRASAIQNPIFSPSRSYRASQEESQVQFE